MGVGSYDMWEKNVAENNRFEIHSKRNYMFGVKTYFIKNIAIRKSVMLQLKEEVTYFILNEMEILFEKKLKIKKKV